MKKRLLSILTALILSLMLLSVTALAADGIPYLDAGGTTKSCDSATEVASSDTTWGTAGTTTWYLAQGQVEINRTVTFSGNVNLILADGCDLTVSGGIMGNPGANLTIYGQTNGTGKLTATGSANTSGSSYGIYACLDAGSGGGNITINGGTVNAAGSAATNDSCGIYADGYYYYGDSEERFVGGNITINGGIVNAAGGAAVFNSCGIYAEGYYDREQWQFAGGNITINGGTVNTNGGASIRSCGIYADSLTVNGGTVIANGGDAVQTKGPSNYPHSYGIYADEFFVNDGSVTATGGNVAGYYGSQSYGICANYNNIVISGGTVNAYGGAAKTFSYGICSYFNEIIISGGTVNAVGGTATDEEGFSDSYGILANTNLKISGGSVTATGDTAMDESFGIFAYHTISISGTAEVDATGGEATNGSYGIASVSYQLLSDEETDGGITISGGEVCATGSQANAESYGVFAKIYLFESYYSEEPEEVRDGRIVVSGGHVIAQTLAEATIDKAALNTAPTLPDDYGWRIADTGDFTAYPTTPYTYSAEHTYVEISSTDDSSDDLPIEWLGGLLLPLDSMVSYPFVDVPPMYYYFDAVNWAVENGITTGTGRLTFSPDAPCTRAEAVTFLWRAAGCPEPKAAAQFTDVDANAYYAKAVAWAVENGITNGTSDTTFSPAAVCTRGQIVTFLCRAFGEASGAATPFTDVAADAYYAGAVSWAAANGVTGGTSDTTFSPDAPCTRAQIVTFLWRVLAA